MAVSPGDSLPSTICDECLQKLKSFYAFRTLCLNNEALLKEQIDQNVTRVKNEFMWDECVEETLHFDDLEEIEQVKTEIFKDECPEFVFEDNPDVSTEDGIEELEPFEDDTKESADAEIVLVVNKNDKTCSVCQKNCHTSTYLKEHIQYEHFGIKYYCNICQKYYNSETLHNRRVHPAEPDASKFYSQCHVCGESFRSRVHYSRHMKSNHQNESLTCHCGRTFNTIAQLNRHRLRAHSEPRFQCDYCSKLFTVKGKLKQHLKRHEDDFASESIHNRRKHREIRTKLYSKSCYICHEQFFSKNLIGKHMREKHGAKRGQCECGFEYSSRAGLMKHRQLVHEKTVFICSVCSKTFKLQKHLDVHMQVHSKSVYPCSYCPVKLKSRRSVVLHERRHNAKRDIPCPHCPLMFRIKTSVVMHEWGHNAKRDIPCPHCPLMFRIKTDLTQHLRTHDPSVKPYVCAICHVKRYRRSDYRNEHERRVHGYDRIKEHRKIGKKIYVKYIPSGAETATNTEVDSEEDLNLKNTPQGEIQLVNKKCYHN